MLMDSGAKASSVCCCWVCVCGVCVCGVCVSWLLELLEAEERGWKKRRCWYLSTMNRWRCSLVAWLVIFCRLKGSVWGWEV